MTSRPPGWRRLLRLTAGAGGVESDVDDEIAFHLVVLGLVVRLAIVIAGRSALSAWLYEVSPTDPLTVIAVAATLLGAAAAASWIPARRATLVSPAEVLRGE